MNFDKAVELALRTWYSKDDPLHFNPHHPLGKLLGEWGELLDDYMKSIYKPGYEFKPEDELGDIWYYIRILVYQKSCKLYDVISSFRVYDTDYIIAVTMTDVSIAFRNYVNYDDVSLLTSYSALIEIAKRYNLTLDDLTISNWQKLKPGSERGDEWMRARVQTDYAGGKIGLKRSDGNV